MKQIICDKCGKKIEKIIIKSNFIKPKEKYDEDIFDNLSEMLDGMGILNIKSETEKMEGSKLIINLPKYKLIKDLDLCENCTEGFSRKLKEWLIKKTKKKK
jgi:hypothetical protein